MRRNIISRIAYLLVCVYFLPGTTSTHASDISPVSVIGFYTKYYPQDKVSYNSVASYGSYMSDIATMTFDVDNSGNIIGTVPTDGLNLAKQKNLKAYLAIANRDSEGVFDKNLAHAVLTNQTTRANTVANIKNLVQNFGYSGVHIDFEDMYPTDRMVFTQFIKELADQLHPINCKVIVSVMSKTEDCADRPWVGTFDYNALGQIADSIQLMSYDENGFWGPPGPVASIPWVKSVLDYAVTIIPSKKIIMGLASYGYDWNLSTNTDNKAVSWKEMYTLKHLPSAASDWNATLQSPSLTYTDKFGFHHIVWYENEESIYQKALLVRKYHLGGVAVWQLGLENEDFWRPIYHALQ